LIRGIEPTLNQLLLELEELGRSNDARETERPRKLLNLERPTAELIHLLLRATRRLNVLEIGTSNGYSTLWLAHAMHQSGHSAARVTSINRNPEKIDAARKNLVRAGLASGVTLIEGDATASIAKLSGPFDCVFFDADRITAPKQLKLLLPTLAADVLLLADNVLSHPDEVAPYIDFVRSLPVFESLTLAVGKGLHLAYRPSHFVKPRDPERTALTGQGFSGHS